MTTKDVGDSRPDDPPIVVVISGPNGAGKSTLAEPLLESVDMRSFVNADDIAREMSMTWQLIRQFSLIASNDCLRKAIETR